MKLKKDYVIVILLFTMILPILVLAQFSQPDWVSINVVGIRQRVSVSGFNPNRSCSVRIGYFNVLSYVNLENNDGVFRINHYFIVMNDTFSVISYKLLLIDTAVDYSDYPSFHCASYGYYIYFAIHSNYQVFLYVVSAETFEIVKTVLLNDIGYLFGIAVNNMYVALTIAQDYDSVLILDKNELSVVGAVSIDYDLIDNYVRSLYPNTDFRGALYGVISSDNYGFTIGLVNYYLNYDNYNRVFAVGVFRINNNLDVEWNKCIVFELETIVYNLRQVLIGYDPETKDYALYFSFLGFRGTTDIIGVSGNAVNDVVYSVVDRVLLYFYSVDISGFYYYCNHVFIVLKTYFVDSSGERIRSYFAIINKTGNIIYSKRLLNDIEYHIYYINDTIYYYGKFYYPWVIYGYNVFVKDPIGNSVVALSDYSFSAQNYVSYSYNPSLGYVFSGGVSVSPVYEDVSFELSELDPSLVESVRLFTASRQAYCCYNIFTTTTTTTTTTTPPPTTTTTTTPTTTETTPTTTETTSPPTTTPTTTETTTTPTTTPTATTTTETTTTPTTTIETTPITTETMTTTVETPTTTYTTYTTITTTTVIWTTTSPPYTYSNVNLVDTLRKYPLLIMLLFILFFIPLIKMYGVYPSLVVASSVCAVLTFLVKLYMFSPLFILLLIIGLALWQSSK